MTNIRFTLMTLAALIALAANVNAYANDNKELRPEQAADAVFHQAIRNPAALRGLIENAAKSPEAYKKTLQGSGPAVAPAAAPDLQNAPNPADKWADEMQ